LLPFLGRKIFKIYFTGEGYRLINMKVHFATLSNNKKVISSILFYGAKLHMEQSTHNVDLYHLDSHEKDKIYKHFYILPYGETRLIFNDLTLKINREKTSMEPLEFHNKDLLVPFVHPLVNRTLVVFLHKHPLGYLDDI